MNCCDHEAWAHRRDLGHASGFDFVLGECPGCGTVWLNVFCVASGTGGYERASAADIESIDSLPNGPELKEFMRRWAAENL